MKSHNKKWALLRFCCTAYSREAASGVVVCRWLDGRHVGHWANQPQHNSPARAATRAQATLHPRNCLASPHGSIWE